MWLVSCLWCAICCWICLMACNLLGDLAHMRFHIEFVDDMICYAKRLDELDTRINQLMDEFLKIGLSLNGKKTQIPKRNPSDDDLGWCFIEM